MKNTAIQSTATILNLILVIAILYVTTQISGMSDQQIAIQRALIEAQL